MMIAPPPASELNTVSALLAVIADPKRSAEALAGIKAAADEYRALAQTATDAQADAARLAAEAAETARQTAEERAKLEADREAVLAKVRALEAKERALAADRKAHDEMSAAWAEAANAKSADLEAREKALAAREARAAETARVADAMVAEYDEKLAKLRALAG